MPATGKSAARPSRATKDARERYERSGRAIDRVAKSLEAAQTDLSALRATMGSGASDLRKDISRLLRDARRDVGKLGRTVRKDLERIQKDLASAAPKRAAPKRARTRSAGRASPSSRSAARAKRSTRAS